MRFDWRVSAGAAGVAFLLSLFTGIVTGVPFGTAVGRAMLGALIFAVAAAALWFVADRYLPGIGRSEGGDRSDEDDRPGSRVDVVIDDTLYEEGEAEAAEAEPDEEIAEFEVAGEDEESGDPGAPDDVAGITSAESLPDIEGFSGSFAETPIEPEEPPDSAESDEGPSMMARAIRTVLRREE